MKERVISLLKWSEKYTKTDMQYLARGGSWLSVGEIGSHAMIFILTIAFANLLPKETYGAYRYILSVAGIFAFFSLAGLNTAVIQSVARGFEKLFNKVMFLKIKFSLIGAVISIAAAIYYYTNGNIELSLSFFIVAIFLPFFDSFNLYTALLTGKKDFKHLTQYKLMGQFTVSVLTILILLLTNNLYILLISYFGLWTIVRGFFYFKTIKTNPLNDKEDNGLIKYGKHLSVMGGLKILANNADRVLLWQFVGPASLAIYYFAIAPVSAISGPIRNMSALVLPKLSEKDFQETRKNFINKVLIASLALIPLIVLYIIFSPFLFEKLFPQYLDAVLYTQVFSLTILFIPTFFITQLLVAHKKQDELYLLNTINPIIRIILLVVLLPAFGIWGAIISIIISYITNLILNLYYVYK